VKDPNALKRGDPGYFDSIPDRGASRYPTGPGAGGDRGGREELPLPTKPPYTAFVGNLAFETEEEDLSMFFEGLEVGFARICNWDCV
jgi:translation initiation factor 4B